MARVVARRLRPLVDPRRDESASHAARAVLDYSLRLSGESCDVHVFALDAWEFRRLAEKYGHLRDPVFGGARRALRSLEGVSANV